MKKKSTKKNVQRYPINPFVIFIASIAAIGGILFGFDTGVISGAILFIKNQFHLTPFTNGVVVSASLVGAIFGAALSGKAADRFGRKRLLMVAALIFIVGTLSSAYSISEMMLIISRIILGLGIGVASFTAPLYISEISPAQLRGALVSLYQLAVTIGIFVSYFVDEYFSKSGNWGGMFVVGVIPAALLFFGLIFSPYSPRWLCLRKQFDQALKVLKKIRHSSHVEVEFKEIKESVEHVGDWHGLLKKWLRPAIWIGIGLGFFQQFTGINTVIYYAPTIFKLSGFSSDSIAIMATMGIGAVNVLATIVAIPLIDKVGRKPLLYVGMTLMAICLFGLSLSYIIATSDLKWIAFTSIIFYVIGFAISLGPIMWLMFTEIFPLKVRGVAISIMASIQWLFNFIVSLTFLTLIKFFHESGTFALYGVICVLGILFVYLKVPETKDVSLEKIEANLRARVPSRDLGE
ncbi:MAG TPA: sugar porter family MFS transporter [Coxiellaceae bacterium]|nr:sugar porter family MFS transporter [Coxiellaceae bacterium]